MEEQVLGAAAAELPQLLIDTETLTDFLAEVSRYAAATVGSGLSCGITLSRDGRPCTVAGSDDTAINLDEVQYGHHDGPCLTSMRTGQVVTIKRSRRRAGCGRCCRARRPASRTRRRCAS